MGQRVGVLGKKQAVAVDVAFLGQAVLGQGGGQKVKVGQEIRGVINGGPGADPRAVVGQVQEGIVFRNAGEPAVRGGVEAPEGADLQALPAASGGGRARRRRRIGQLVGNGPAAWTL